MIMDSFHEKYAEFVQFLFDEYIFALIPQVPQKEYKIDVVGENLLLLKSSIGSGDSLGSLLNGWISFSTILNLVEESKSVYSLTALKAGRPCSFLIDLDDNSLQKFEYEFDDTHKVIIQKTEDGHKVAFEEIIYDYELKFIEGTVTSNFYNAVIDLGENAVLPSGLPMFSRSISTSQGKLKKVTNFTLLWKRNPVTGILTDTAE